jgi:hypothetical protein
VTDPHQLLRELLDACPGAVQVNAPRAWIEALLAQPTRPAAERELTVEDLCQRYGRKRSAVRGWLERGDFPGAYRLQGRRWLVPHAALEAFEAAQRAGQSRAGKANGNSSPPDLSAWRGVRGGQAA